LEAWINQVLSSQVSIWLMLPAGLLLGLVSSVACLGCSAPIFLSALGYAGSGGSTSAIRNPLVTSLSFMAGTVVALSIIGALAGLIGQAALSQFGVYGKILLAFLAILFGLATLDFLPVRLQLPSLPRGKMTGGLVSSILFGLAFGAVSAAYLMGCCGPVMLPVVLGLSALQGQVLTGALVLACFAIGYSLPVSLAILGIGFGKMASLTTRISKPIQVISGVLLIGAGFWILLTI
jgi:cytochrome c-type biogenesis protein